MEKNIDLSAIIIRYLLMLIGLVLLATAIVLSTEANLGVSCWTVFHVGIADQIGWTQGQVTQIVGFIIVIACFFLGIYPAPATICNMLLVGRFVDLIANSHLISTPATLGERILFLLISIIINGIGSALYISVHLGAGPRDSLMLALTKKTGGRIGLIRNSMEICVLLIGWLLGGPVGIGTLLYALSIGPVLELNLHALRYLNEEFQLQRFIAVIKPKPQRKAKTA